jgi:hypothetical protein
MQPRFFLLAVATILTAGTAFGDDMVFQRISSQSSVWQGYWTSPYLVMDQSVPPSGELLTVYCLDFNHEVAPPYEWDAIITPLDPSNVSHFQYGLSTALPWQHYAAAASLFKDIEQLLVDNPADAKLKETEYQVAAWKLFVDAGPKADELNSKITATGAPFEAEVTRLYNQALTEGSAALTEPDWFVVTTDPDWATAHAGVPVQEFLIHRDPPPVPEPAAILLLGTVAGLLGLRMRFGRPAQSR